MPQIALIPLDERPVNTRYPEMLAAIGGADLLLPPRDIWGHQRIPANLTRVMEWLQNLVERGEVQSVVASCDYLGYGNLINARISEDTATDVLGRLSLLERVGAKVPVHAFSLITRVSNADDNIEEPLYWKEWGTKLYAYARLAHRHEERHQSGELTEDERAQLDAIRSTMPPELASDWLTRRLRNHAVNLALIDMAARGKVASLLLTSDDTAPFGFPTRERNWLRAWLEMIVPAPSAHIRMHPGADEVGSALVTRLINQAAGIQPRVWIEYAVPGGEELVAPYEDRPVRETVLGQIEACGCVPAESPGECDFVLGVVTPSPRRADYNPDFTTTDRAERVRPYRAFLRILEKLKKAGSLIALADVAYPNGSDPLFSELLFSGEFLLAKDLTAYGAWNTAGNTLGTTVAHAACALQIGSDAARAQAQNIFFAHRFLEDDGYQRRVRSQARRWAESQWGRHDPNPDSPAEVAAVTTFIEDKLARIFAGMQAAGIGLGLRLEPGSVRLPWRRLFEVDFNLILT